ncbi:MAG: SpoIIE family protein phosphatase [Acidobacteriia bacterium]|nr:SpoIIE family protein phosphatase [Terriglobia bacterium]
MLPIRSLHRHPAWGHRAERARHQSESMADVVRRSLALEGQLAELRSEHDRLRHSIFEAAHVQRKLCGTRHLRRGSFEIASEIFPVRDLSGDFISVFEIEDELVFAIGDIAGKGLSAGMWFTHLVSMLRLQCATHRSPAKALAAMNRDLLRLRLELPLTSLLLCRLKVKSGEMAYCNAGHPPALLLRRDGLVESLTEGGPLLGALDGASFAKGNATLQPGDTLVGYTDGIAECGNGTGTDFGMDRLLAAAQTSSGSSASATLFSVLGAVEDFAGSHAREDDISLIVVHRASV